MMWHRYLAQILARAKSPIGWALQITGTIGFGIVAYSYGDAAVFAGRIAISSARDHLSWRGIALILMWTTASGYVCVLAARTALASLLALGFALADSIRWGR